jgi:hypothetical protein
MAINGSVCFYHMIGRNLSCGPGPGAPRRALPGAGAERARYAADPFFRAPAESGNGTYDRRRKRSSIASEHTMAEQFDPMAWIP